MTKPTAAANAAGLPNAAASPDPLAELIGEYRRQTDEFNRRAPHEDWTTLSAETSGPPLNLLWHHTPEPNSPVGVLAALLLARDEPSLYALDSINDACIRYLTAAASTEASTSIEDLAAADWEPWVKEEGGWEPPTFEEWPDLANPLLSMLRLGYEMAHKTKGDLKAAVLAAPELHTNLYEQLVDASRTFQGWAMAIDAASARLICAIGSAVSENEVRS